MFLDSELNREVTNGNPASETLGSERKTLPSFEGQLLVVRICYEIGLHFRACGKGDHLGSTRTETSLCMSSLWVNFPATCTLSSYLHQGVLTFYIHQQPSAPYII